MSPLLKTPQELVSEMIMGWPSVRVPISMQDIVDFAQHFGENLSPDFDTSVFALLLPSREDYKLSEPLISEGDTITKFLVTLGADVWLAVVVKIDGYWRIQAFTFRCPRCFGQGYYYSGSELCPECGGTGWGATGDLEFRPGKRGRIQALAGTQEVVKD
ncbi:MAG: hypothetical protein HXY40_10570 [Chloroflexi bacterium]|nr:hypothetical protein [Chloroflexota bacterium]